MPFCGILQSKSGVDKMIQYAPAQDPIHIPQGLHMQGQKACLENWDAQSR